MTDFNSRKPYVAGYFYPKNKNELQKFVELAIKNKAKKESRIVVAPHAGYIYSGNCAGYSFNSLTNFLSDYSTVILLGPNHTGYGTKVSVSLLDWETPLGVLKCNKEFVKELENTSNLVKVDETAHLYEHSIEVMLPFLQVINSNIEIVCICMLDQSLKSSQIVAKNIYDTLNKLNLTNNFCIVCSSDFTHYESADSARIKDMQCIEGIMNLDSLKFHEILHKLDASICGYGPITVGIEIAKLFELKNPVLNHYTNSGERTKDYSEVVAYASISF
ncbi:MAG: AmmeMemoRadiSam system protein B [Candidatus Anstonellales archaeon]